MKFLKFLMMIWLMFFYAEFRKLSMMNFNFRLKNFKFLFLICCIFYWIFRNILICVFFPQVGFRIFFNFLQFFMMKWWISNEKLEFRSCSFLPSFDEKNQFSNCICLRFFQLSQSGAHDFFLKKCLCRFLFFIFLIWIFAVFCKFNLLMFSNFSLILYNLKGNISNLAK